MPHERGVWVPLEALPDVVRAVFNYRRDLGRNGGCIHPVLDRVFPDLVALAVPATRDALPETGRPLPKRAAVGPFVHEVSVGVAAEMLGVSVRLVRDLARDGLGPRGEAYQAGSRGLPWVLDREAVERLAVARSADGCGAVAGRSGAERG
jgi:hypothetical protein